MNEQSQRVVALWLVVLLPFIFISGYLSVRNRLTLNIVGLYWFPVVVLTLIGTIPPPWQPLVE